MSTTCLCEDMPHYYWTGPDTKVWGPQKAWKQAVMKHCFTDVCNHPVSKISMKYSWIDNSWDMLNIHAWYIIYTKGLANPMSLQPIIQHYLDVNVYMIKIGYPWHKCSLTRLNNDINEELHFIWTFFNLLNTFALPKCLNKPYTIDILQLYNKKYSNH